MDKIGFKRIIALTLIIALCLFTGFELYKTGSTSETFKSTVITVVAFYFARSNLKEVNDNDSK